jgi:hypothetical protein
MKRVIRRNLKKYQLAGPTTEPLNPYGQFMQPIGQSMRPEENINYSIGEQYGQEFMPEYSNPLDASRRPGSVIPRKFGYTATMAPKFDSPQAIVAANIGVPKTTSQVGTLNNTGFVRPTSPDMGEMMEAEKLKGVGTNQSTLSKEGYQIFGANSGTSKEDLDAAKENYNKNKIKNPQKIQFFNPYGGVDIPTAATSLGSFIEDDNTLGVVGSGLKLAAGLTRNVMGGMGAQRRNNQVMNEYYETSRNDLVRPEGEYGGYFGDGKFVPFKQEFKKGGEVDLPQALTGEYLSGMDKQNPMVEPNAEIETDEIVQHPNGEIQTAKGDTHEAGGMDVNLEEGTKILSDHLKIGGDLARRMSKEFGIKLRASDTYAQVIEKHDKKSGLSEANKEQEDVIRKMETQDETKNEATLGLNIQHLSNKINDLESTKKPLKEARKSVFNELFEAQENSKPKNPAEEKMFEDGGIIKTLSEKYGITEDRARELTSSMFQYGGELPEYEDGSYTPAMRKERFKDFYTQAKVLGYTGEIDVDSKDLDMEAGKLQTWMSKNHPELVAKYSRGVDMTSKGVDNIKRDNPDVFSKLGIDPNKQSSQYTPEEKTRIKESLGDKLDDSFWIDQFQDSKWTFRYPGAPVEAKPIGGNDDSLISAPLMRGYAGNQEVPAAAEPEQVEGLQDVKPKEPGDKNGLYFPMLPDQSPMRPDSLQPHLKIRRRFDRVDPALVSQEANIVELNRNADSAMDSFRNLPGSQNAAAVASLSANTQDNINKAFQQANTFNSQVVAQADGQNARTQAMEENAAAQDALSYEQRQYRAMALTDIDERNYFNTMQANNVKNYNEINNLNAVNAMADHYQYDGNSFIQTDTPTFRNANSSASEADRIIEEERLKKEALAKKTRLSKKKLGGRFSNK